MTVADPDVETEEPAHSAWRDLRNASRCLVDALEFQLRYARALETFVEAAYSDCYECVAGAGHEEAQTAMVGYLVNHVNLVMDRGIDRELGRVRRAHVDLG